MKKKQKVGMSGLNWFLSVVGILFFASLIFLPPIFRAVFTDDEGIGSTTNPENQEKTITTCIKKEQDKDSEYMINSSNDTIEMLAESLIYHYSENDANLADDCIREAGLYQKIAGFHHGCRIDGNDMIVDSRVEVKEYKEEEIPILFDVHDKASSLKSSLLRDGFQCETKNQ